MEYQPKHPELLQGHIKEKLTMHIDTYVWFRVQIFERIDKHLYELAAMRDFDKMVKALDEIEAVLAHLEEMDKKFGLADDEKEIIDDELD